MKEEKFRRIKLSSGTEILLGKNAEQNESLVARFIGRENAVLHTEKPGSPFCVIENPKPEKSEIKEAAVCCARYSRDWRDNKGDVEVHIFPGKEIFKEKTMALGTFGVKKFKTITAKKKEIEKITKDK